MRNMANTRDNLKTNTHKPFQLVKGYDKIYVCSEYKTIKKQLK